MHSRNSAPIKAFTPMPQLTTVDVRDLKGYRKREDESEIEDGVEMEQKQCWENGAHLGNNRHEAGKDLGSDASSSCSHWGHCPRWIRCLAPVAALWFVIQEETHFPEFGGRLLLAVILFIGLAFYFVSLLKFLYQYRRQYKQNNVSEKSEIVGKRINQPHQTSLISQQDAGHLLSMVRALLDGLVVSILQEPVSDPRVSQIQGLISKLEAVFEVITVAANNSVPIEVQLLQTNNNEEKAMKSKVEDRVKHICTYLQERVSDLRVLLQTQDEYGVCLANVQQELQEYWEQLEDLHTKVTLQPEKCQDPEDPHTVLTDTEGLYTKLGLFQSRIHECQVHLSTSTHLLEELEIKHHSLAQTMGLTVKSTWTKDLLQCNTQQFEKVFKDSASLSQQTLTFVRHLQDLSVSQERNSIKTSDVEHVQSSSSPPSSLPVYGIVPVTENTPSDPEPRPTHTPSSKYSVMNLLCGVRRRR
ncbi:uncharacterized protein si:ch211-151h10.2 [Tachysurus fulvidraco]|uniref:uncharacterized protein si:ch211-151h10.2 n=1 Tax=Tachysurus fulvidraco TaxID=1234273 RepID=UPI000F4EAF56|nr:uncharacterized protein si:ch211-151h10.2 [Tachysurus fulvidraco]